jgi:hypothetical protein
MSVETETHECCFTALVGYERNFAKNREEFECPICFTTEWTAWKENAR